MDYTEVIIDHLIFEGYADSIDCAIAMVNHMSDEWAESILSEAQRDADRGVSPEEAMKRHGIKPKEGPYKVVKLPAKKAPKRRK